MAWYWWPVLLLHYPCIAFGVPYVLVRYCEWTMQELRQNDLMVLILMPVLQLPILGLLMLCTLAGSVSCMAEKATEIAERGKQAAQARRGKGRDGVLLRPSDAPAPPAHHE